MDNYQKAFSSPLTIFTNVCNIICKSSQYVQFSIYHKSCSTLLLIKVGSLVSPRNPLVCAQPVIPGFTQWRIMYFSTLSFDCMFSGTGLGLGPTTDIEPRNTLIHCGNSSKFVSRK